MSLGGTFLPLRPDPVLFRNPEMVRRGPALVMAPTMMTYLISPERVIPRLYAPNTRQAICELTRVAAKEVPLSRNMISQAILERGETSTFGFGRGVAIPHASIRGLERPLGVFARLSPAQDFGAADELPADLAFLLLSPEGDDPTHLRALAWVVRRLRDREIAARLRSAQDAEAIHVVLTSDAWRGESLPDQSSASAPAMASTSHLAIERMGAGIRALC